MDDLQLGPELTLDFSDWIHDGLDGLFAGDLEQIFNSLGSPTFAVEDKALWPLNTVAQAEADVDQFETPGAPSRIGVAPPYTPSVMNHGTVVEGLDSPEDHNKLPQPSCLDDTSACPRYQAPETYRPCENSFHCGDLDTTQEIAHQPGKSHQVTLEPHTDRSLQTSTAAAGNESDSSWDERDSMEYFCDSIRQCLDDIVDFNKERYFITDYLNRGKRRLVHALAHMRRLSHMTLETSEGRRTLVSTAEISCKSTSTPRKCWNERASTWKLDPQSLLMLLPSHITGDLLRQTFMAMALPIPITYCEIANSGDEHVLLTEFRTVGSAAKVLDCLQSKFLHTGSGNGEIINVDGSYRYWNHRTNTPASFQDFANSSRNQLWTRTLLFPLYRDWGSWSTADELPRTPSIPTRASNTRRRSKRSRRSLSCSRMLSDGDESSNSRSSSKRSHATFMSDGFSATRNRNETHEELATTDASSDTMAKRRKRYPKQEGGYPCSEAGCGMIFDYHGERTEHERIHRPKEEHPHACTYCDKRFINAKDLKRHERTHLRKWLPGSEKQRTTEL